ncbi:hypothetical protein [Pseudomonas sp. HLT2-19-2]
MKFERRVVLFTGVGIICLVAYLLLRGEPITDTTLAQALRIILALAVAVLGGGVVGESLRLKFDGLGFAIRAAGAAALFVICFFSAPEIEQLNLRTANVRVEKIKQIDFRSQASPEKDDETRLASPVYVTVPISLSNEAQPALNAFVRNSKVQFKLNGKDYVYDWRNFVVMHEERYGLWLGIVGDASQFQVASGSAEYREILHSNDSALTWGDFLNTIKTTNNQKIKIDITINIDDKEATSTCEVAISEWSSKVQDFISNQGKSPGRVTMPCV